MLAEVQRIGEAERLAGAVGVGPVIAGRAADKQPCYFFEVAYRCGRVRRVVCLKTQARGDKTAKAEATLLRLSIANCLRQGGNCVLAHDQASFSGLLALVQLNTVATTSVDRRPYAGPERRFAT